MADDVKFSPDFDSPRIDSSASLAKEKGKNEQKDTSKASSKKIKSDLAIRLMSGSFYAAFIVGGCLLTNIGTMIMLMIASGICAGEFFAMERCDAKLPNEFLGIVGAVAFTPAVYFFGVDGAACVILGLMLALLVWYVCWTRARIADVCVSFFGAIYTGGLLSLLLVIRTHVDAPEPLPGVFLLILIFSLSINDGAAYLFGRKLGRHSLAPHISPKKSWEGFAFGLLFGTAAWFLFLLIPGVNMQIWQCVVFGLITSVAGVLGDLTESRIKRNAGVKDSGNLLPGHGGLLDRMDSVFLVSLFAFVLLFAGGCLTW